MEYEINAAGDKGRLVLESRMTVENAQALHGALLDPNVTVGELIVDMSGVCEVDITCLQLLCAAHHSAIREGRKLSIEGVGPEVAEIMGNLGIYRHVGCRDDAAGSCLWLMNEKSGY